MELRRPESVGSTRSLARSSRRDRTRCHVSGLEMSKSGAFEVMFVWSRGCFPSPRESCSSGEFRKPLSWITDLSPGSPVPARGSTTRFETRRFRCDFVATTRSGCGRWACGGIHSRNAFSRLGFRPGNADAFRSCTSAMSSPQSVRCGSIRGFRHRQERLGGASCGLLVPDRPLRARHRRSGDSPRLGDLELHCGRSSR